MHISNKCSVAVHCLIVINEFGREKRITSEVLSKSTGVNPAAVRGIMSALKKDGIISVRQGTGGTALCCPPEEISLYRICRAVEPDFLQKIFGVHSSPSEKCPVGRNINTVLGKSYAEVAAALSESLKSVTMEKILKDYQNVLNKNDYSSPSGFNGLT
ncbi:MAG: Rrf2 family transcriptional regulator [Ruminococcus sp.]|nr:Rrf2 family transcriptional regulator [Ruminococcus sp.]MCM1381533.1 Rrf2 family transcriptional regulator [Muribaculaceae bacterium]MCM1479558.1 Rrf2 family transcriptional regulator [Muribaculaceae bacterium]